MPRRCTKPIKVSKQTKRELKQVRDDDDAPDGRTYSEAIAWLAGRYVRAPPRRQYNEIGPTDTTVAVTPACHTVLTDMKKAGESFEELFRRLLTTV